MKTNRRNSFLIKKFIARNGFFTLLPIPDDLKVVEPEINLGRHILDRALLDAVTDKEVEKWFDLKDEDFKTICLISWMSPHKVLKIANKIIFLMRHNKTLGDILPEDFLHK